MQGRSCYTPARNSSLAIRCLLLHYRARSRELGGSLRTGGCSRNRLAYAYLLGRGDGEGDVARSVGGDALGSDKGLALVGSRRVGEDLEL